MLCIFTDLFSLKSQTGLSCISRNPLQLPQVSVSIPEQRYMYNAIRLDQLMLEYNLIIITTLNSYELHVREIWWTTLGLGFNIDILCLWPWDVMVNLYAVHTCVCVISFALIKCRPNTMVCNTSYGILGLYSSVWEYVWHSIRF